MEIRLSRRWPPAPTWSGIARPLIADPDFPTKLLSGRESQIRPCVSCNEDCRAFDPVLLCSVNPDLAPPGLSRRPAKPLVAQCSIGAGEASGRVAIVGAGPAGLECAASLAGQREIVLFDERPAIGGNVAIAAAAPHRHGWRSLLDFHGSALDAAPDLELRLGAPATVAELQAFEDVVIAAGSTEILPDLPGIDRAVSAAEAIDARGAGIAPGSTVLVVDDGFGSWRCASAVELAIGAKAARITVVTPGAAFGATLPPEGRAQLLARLRGAPLDVRPFTALEALRDSRAELRNVMSHQSDVMAVDSVIVVGERRPRDWRALVPTGATVRVIGDAVVPRRVSHAISEGRVAAEAITHAGSRDRLSALE